MHSHDSDFRNTWVDSIITCYYPILTGLFESKFLPGGVNLTPLSDLGPKGADRREILHGCQDTCKEYCYDLFLAKNSLFIMLLWFMQIRCIIITYLPPRSEAVLISSASVSVSVCLFVCRCSNVWMVPFQFTKLSANLHLSNMRFAIEFHGHRCICFFFFFFSILFHLNFQALLSKLILIL